MHRKLLVTVKLLIVNLFWYLLFKRSFPHISSEYDLENNFQARIWKDRLKVEFDHFFLQIKMKAQISAIFYTTCAQISK